MGVKEVVVLFQWNNVVIPNQMTPDLQQCFTSNKNPIRIHSKLFITNISL